MGPVLTAPSQRRCRCRFHEAIENINYLRMKRLRYISKVALLAAPLFFASSCTNLDENIYDQLVTNNFYNNRGEVLSAVLRPYTHANAWITPGQNGWWRLSELSADQLAWPQKGRHGYDGGNWIRLHYHTWTADESTIRTAWSLMWWGLGLCTDPIEALESKDAASMGITEDERLGYVAELKLLRAYHYIKILDLWGNVPIVTKVGEPVSPPTASRAEVFAFIEREILDNIDLVPVLSNDMLGRMSRAGGYAMLVELYLNAEKWSGQPRWSDCIAAADKLISGEAGGLNGAAALDPNVLDTYKPDNHLSKEGLFAIAYDYQIPTPFQPQWPGDFYYFNQRAINGGGRNGNDGVVVIPGVYTTFDDDDERKKEWFLIGPQYRFDDPTEPVLGANDEYTNEPLVFVDNIRQNLQAVREGIDPETLPSNMTTGEGNSGVRFNKYRIGHLEHPSYNSTDWWAYRLTWIYFAKAEALMRQNGGAATSEAVSLINECIARAYAPDVWPSKAYTTASLTLDALLAERGREFIFEGFRRQDLIRFDKFLSESWWDHEPTNDPNKLLFPVPNQQRSLNPNLDQNPGYLN